MLFAPQGWHPARTWNAMFSLAGTGVDGRGGVGQRCRVTGLLQSLAHSRASRAGARTASRQAGKQASRHMRMLGSGPGGMVPHAPREGLGPVAVAALVAHGLVGAKHLDDVNVEPLRPGLAADDPALLDHCRAGKGQVQGGSCSGRPSRRGPPRCCGSSRHGRDAAATTRPPGSRRLAGPHCRRTSLDVHGREPDGLGRVAARDLLQLKLVAVRVGGCDCE